MIIFFESDNFSENRKEFEMNQPLFFETLTDKLSNLHFFFLGKLVKATDIRYQYQCGTRKLSIQNVYQNNLNFKISKSMGALKVSHFNPFMQSKVIGV